MSRDWKPGEIGLVSLPSGGFAASVLVGHDPAKRCWHSTDQNGDLRCLNESAVEVRPLVTIDPNHRAQVERLRNETLRALRDHLGNRAVDEMTFTETDLSNAMQDALREFANPTPAKPDEPTGLGAVVEDAEGKQWVRVWNARVEGKVWTQGLEHDGRSIARHYSDIAVVRVLSEGIS